MGITNLLVLLREITQNRHIRQFAGKKVAVDAYCWLHNVVVASRSGGELILGLPTTRWIQYFLQRLHLLLNHNVIPIFVWDGRKLPAKQGVESTRANNRNSGIRAGLAKLETGRKTEAQRDFQDTVDVTPEMAARCIKVLRKMNVECIVAPYEADAQLAYLALSNYVDAVISEDSDLLVYGCPKVLFKLQSTGWAEEISLRDVLHSPKSKFYGLNFEQFRQCCILAGCDYVESVRGVGLQTALKLIQREKCIHRACRALRLHGASYSVPSDYERRTAWAELVFRFQRVFRPRQSFQQAAGKTDERVESNSNRNDATLVCSNSSSGWGCQDLVMTYVTVDRLPPCLAAWSERVRSEDTSVGEFCPKMYSLARCPYCSTQLRPDHLQLYSDGLASGDFPSYTSFGVTQPAYVWRNTDQPLFDPRLGSHTLTIFSQHLTCLDVQIGYPFPLAAINAVANGLADPDTFLPFECILSDSDELHMTVQLSPLPTSDVEGEPPASTPDLEVIPIRSASGDTNSLMCELDTTPQDLSSSHQDTVESTVMTLGTTCPNIAVMTADRTDSLGETSMDFAPSSPFSVAGRDCTMQLAYGQNSLDFDSSLFADSRRSTTPELEILESYVKDDSKGEDQDMVLQPQAVKDQLTSSISIIEIMDDELNVSSVSLAESVSSSGFLIFQENSSLIADSNSEGKALVDLPWLPTESCGPTSLTPHFLVWSALREIGSIILALRTSHDLSAQAQVALTGLFGDLRQRQSVNADITFDYDLNYVRDLTTVVMGSPPIPSNRPGAVLAGVIAPDQTDSLQRYQAIWQGVCKVSSKGSFRSPSANDIAKVFEKSAQASARGPHPQLGFITNPFAPIEVSATSQNGDTKTSAIKFKHKRINSLRTGGEATVSSTLPLRRASTTSSVSISLAPTFRKSESGVSDAHAPSDVHTEEEIGTSPQVETSQLHGSAEERFTSRSLCRTPTITTTWLKPTSSVRSSGTKRVELSMSGDLTSPQTLPIGMLQQQQQQSQQQRRSSTPTLGLVPQTESSPLTRDSAEPLLDDCRSQAKPSNCGPDEIDGEGRSYPTLSNRNDQQSSSQTGLVSNSFVKFAMRASASGIVCERVLISSTTTATTMTNNPNQDAQLSESPSNLGSTLGPADGCASNTNKPDSEATPTTATEAPRPNEVKRLFIPIQIKELSRSPPEPAEQLNGKQEVVELGVKRQLRDDVAEMDDKLPSLEPMPSVCEDLGKDRIRALDTCVNSQVTCTSWSSGLGSGISCKQIRRL